MPCSDCKRLERELQKEQAIARHWERTAKLLRKQLNNIRQSTAVATDRIERHSRIHG